MTGLEERVGDSPPDIELRFIVARLWAGRIWIFASVVIFTAGAVAVGLLMEPVYRATTILVDATADRRGMSGLSTAISQLGGLASLAGLDLGSGTSQVEESIAVLRSRQFTESFIVDNNLMPKLFSDRWDERLNSFVGNSEQWPTLAQAYRYFDGGIRTITRDRVTGLIALSIEWRDPVEAAEWTNQLVARLNEEMRSRAIASTNASVGYLERELSATSTIETRMAITRLMEAQINQRMLANVTVEFAFRVVDRAMPADMGNPIRPKRVVFLAMGILLGTVLGVVVVLLSQAFSRGRRAAR